MIWGDVVIGSDIGSDIGLLVFGAPTNATDLSEYQIVVTDNKFNPTEDREVLITIYAR